MNDSPTLHRLAREIFSEALAAVDPYKAVKDAIRLTDSKLHLGDSVFDAGDRRGAIYAIAIGKAAPKMAVALSERLGDSFTAGVLSGPPKALAFNGPSALDRWEIFEGGHPFPNQQSLEAADAAFQLLQRADRDRALVVFLISGGGSALMDWPRVADLTLDDLSLMNRTLVNCGAAIEEINSVRRAVSVVKGGGLAAAAPNCDQVTLIVSDTPSGQEATVASGPTMEPPVDAPDPGWVVSRYDLSSRLPTNILRAVAQFRRGEHPLPVTATRVHHVLLDNETAIQAVAKAAVSRGFHVDFASDVTDQPIQEGCTLLLDKLLSQASLSKGDGKGICVVSGGEFSCPVRGAGIGGRNSESALRIAIELDKRFQKEQLNLHVVALCAGTDGIDGNSPAAGAIADEATVARGRNHGLNPQRFLDASDAFSFFDTLSDTVVTGPTGTNVRDLRILLVLRR